MYITFSFDSLEIDVLQWTVLTAAAAEDDPRQPRH